ncbi:hypothetical protein AB0942_22110 [Streptomyces nodosus]|uniref:hypothetical protein n=1 Tax=Streptomyces nodosus TaxID=40318 RepID=UPI003451BC0C
MANPGYGKRAAPGQLPRTNHDFTHLPPREAAVASYVDRLPEGSDISVKTLARTLPYGQCALRTALNRIQRAGHLRRGRERMTTKDGGTRWVTRSWFSRTARDDAWWVAFVRGDVPREPPPEAHRPATRSRAHVLLAALGRTAPVLSLSQADCARLAPLLTEWFERGATDEAVLRALTSGLPTPVHHPAALVRSRLTDKLPPEPVPEPPRRPLRLLECVQCGLPGRPEALPEGSCDACRGGPGGPAHGPAPLPSSAVRTHAAGIRSAMAAAKPC